MHVIFAIDDCYQSTKHTKAFLDGLTERQIDYKVMQGRYLMRNHGEYVEEMCFLISETDFDACSYYLYEYIKGQESVLYVTECNKQYATLHYRDYRRDPEHLGCFKDVGQVEAEANGEYTYDAATGRYFICVPNGQSEAPAERDARELWAAIEAVLEQNGDEVSCDQYDRTMRRLQDVCDTQKPKWL